jgi:hypothetical protein
MRTIHPHGHKRLWPTNPIAHPDQVIARAPLQRSGDTEFDTRRGETGARAELGGFVGRGLPSRLGFRFTSRERELATEQSDEYKDESGDREKVHGVAIAAYRALGNLIP